MHAERYGQKHDEINRNHVCDAWFTLDYAIQSDFFDDSSGNDRGLAVQYQGGAPILDIAGQKLRSALFVLFLPAVFTISSFKSHLSNEIMRTINLVKINKFQLHLLLFSVASVDRKFELPFFVV